MKSAFPGIRFSLRTRLIVAFLAVAALPMLVATWFAATLVADAFEDNIRHWLAETSSFFVRVLENRRRDATAVSEFLLADKALTATLISGGTLPKTDAALLDVAGLDLVAILDEHGAVVYSNTPVQSLTEDAPYLFRARDHSRDRDMIGGAAKFESNGHRYSMVLGDWLEEDFIDESELVTSLTLRLFYREGGAFRQIYSSHGAADAGHALVPTVVAALEKGTHETFVHEGGDDDYRAIYTALRGPDGKLVGVLFCGLGSKGTLNGLVTRTRLFIAVLGLGSLLSIVAALWLSRRLLVPLQSLSEGVRAIDEGDYGRSVAVLRNDELGELALGFNAMSEKLAHMQEIEQQLRRQERLGALGEMALGLAHEVRNPLGIIQTSAQLLQRQAELEERDAKLLEYVIDEVRRIDTLIAEFMDFASPGPAALHPMRPSNTLARVCAFCDPEFARRGITCELDDNATLAEILGDERLMHQALLNLVLNAIEAMPNGGRLSISARQSIDSVTIEVADTGPGVPEAQRERIFNPFFTTKDKGSGLGLPKVFAIMEQLGGSIEYVERAGGAVFRLRLPLNPLVAAPSAPIEAKA